MKDNFISVRGAKEHNLKNIDIDIPRGKLVVITGLSGSGKSSLAFDTIYAEGQRRYVESLSAYARQFLNIQDKPDVESIDGLSPAIAIDQKTTSKNPRSTVGTVTEIYDYMRLLFARIGVPYSPATGLPIESQEISQMVDRLMELPEGTKLLLLATIVRGRKGEYLKELKELQRKGFTRIKIDGELYEIDETPKLDKQKKHDIEVVVDRIVIKPDLGNRLADSLQTTLELSDGLAVAEILPPEGEAEENKIVFSSHFACPVSGFTIEEIEPRLFSFNSPFGACPKCDGLGTEMFFDPDMVVPDTSKSLYDGAIAPWSGSSSKYYMQTIDGLAEHYKFSPYDPFRDLPKEIQDIILYGSGDEVIKIHYHEGTRSFTAKKPFEGVIGNLTRRYHETESNWVREEMEKFQTVDKCSACNGYRLRPEALAVRVGDLHIGQVCEFTIEHAAQWFDELEAKLTKTQRQIADKILKEIRERLGFLINVGLDYLTLSRHAGTLSGGEAQRIRLASQVGSGLSGVLYVLDEPSIGLHQCDNDRLLTTLQNLRDLGNTVLVVEHDEETMRAAEWLIDMGVGAGIHGGEVIAQGTAEEVMTVKNSITGQYLSGKKQIALPAKRRKPQKSKQIRIKGARANNLRGVDVDIPLGLFTCVTGVSGGGKSSLVIETLYKAVMRHLHASKAHPGAYDSIHGIEYIDKIIEIIRSETPTATIFLFMF